LYISAPLKSIQDKLDRHILNGLTSDELGELADAEGMTLQKAIENAKEFMKDKPYRLPDIVPLLKIKEGSI